MTEKPPVSNTVLNEKTVLITSIFVAGICSIIYELLISTTSSYFMGNSIKQFSITIGVYMASMGLGSYLSRLLKEQLLQKFILSEILLGLIGGSSVPLLYVFYANFDTKGFMVMMILLVTAIGMLSGLGIPLLTRIMKIYYPLKINLSNVLSFDYLGALVATLVFPFVLLPWLGIFKSSLIFGLLNLAVGFINLWYFTDVLQSRSRRAYHFTALAVLIYFVTLLCFSQGILQRWNNDLYSDDIIYYRQTPFQQLTLTKGGEDIRLYTDGSIQWSSVDEYRYHESLVHPSMALAASRRNILVLGGGEGMTARELLKYPEVEQITIIDFDPEVFRLGRENNYVRALNQASLDHPKVRTISTDAFHFLQDNRDKYDLIISTLPNPTNESLARLYSREFFRMIKQHLSPFGIFVTQATSPFHAQKAFWCIEASAKAGGFTETYPYHAYVPSFGDWGFVLASNHPLQPQELEIEPLTRFLDTQAARNLFYFEKDLQLDSVPFSTLDRPILLDLYLEDWTRWADQVQIQ